MIKLRILTYSISLLIFSVSIANAQNVLLRHRFNPGQSAQAVTDVLMKGDSLITGTQAATNLRMRMLREMRVQTVDSMGNAALNVTVQRIQTNGKMNESKFNKDLTGNQLQQVMFGGTDTSMQISPLGHVSGGSENPLKKMGISLPSELPGTGGFECPTFPVDPVRIGDTWTENGELLRGTMRNTRNAASGTQVYRLQSVLNTPQGRKAIIRYRKTTDLSGMSLLGGESAALGGLSDAASSVQVGGLVIQLEGEIEFNIDRGVVTKSTQQGLWNLNMNLPSVAGQKNVSVNQRGMKIRIQTNLQWKGLQNTNQQAQKQQPQIQQPKINPPLDLPPKIEVETP